MRDELMEHLGQQWRRQEFNASEMRRRVQRGRLVGAMAMAVEAVILFAALASGLWFVTHAVRDGELAYWLSAAAMLVAAPAFAAASLFSRREGLVLADETPPHLLNAGVRQAQATLRAIRISRWQLIFLLVFLALLWLAQVAGLQQQAEFLVVFSIVVGVVVPAVWLWLAWREARVRRELVVFCRIIAQFKQATKDEVAPYDV